MTTVATRVRAIANREGFDLIAKSKRTGNPIKVAKNGVLGPYPFNKKLKDSKTVNDFKRERFENSYPGYSCDILLGDGKKAAPQTTLRAVRATY